MSKNPFAEDDVNTYTYPEPWDPAKSKDAVKIDDEVAGDPKPPWIKVKVPNNKGLNDAIGDFTQQVVTSVGLDGNSYVTETSIESRISRANAGVFGLLVTGWSFSEEPTQQEYRRLQLWAGQWVDACLTDAMRQGQAPLMGKVPSTSETPSDGPPASRRAKSSA